MPDRPSLLKTGTSVPAASEIVDATFKEDTRIQQIYSEHLATRTQHAIPNALKAHAALAKFAPSRFTQLERQPGQYLAPGDDLTATMAQIAQKGVDRIRNGSDRQGLRVELTQDFKNLLKQSGGGSGIQTIDLPTMLQIIATKLPTAPTLRKDPALTACTANLEAQKRLDEIEGTNGSPIDYKNKEDRSPDSGLEDKEPAEVKDFVSKHIHNLLANVPSPEETPRLGSPAAADRGQVRQSIQNFELRSGASDVTSYHDFNSLQIAFDHVWAEVFDLGLVQLGQRLYEQYANLLDFVGSPIDPVTHQPIQPPPTVTSIDDIKTLIQNASMLGQVISNATPVSALPSGISDAFSQVRQTLINELVNQMRQVPDAYDLTMLQANAGAMVDIDLSPLKSQIDQAITQSTNSAQKQVLEETLPAVERLYKLLENMQDLLSTPYSFTVYREKSCNFGILVTYRQAWQPEQYQVGDLVSTIPLAPRETRRYTTKQVTKKSRALKEIANNLSSVRTDIDTTGRADRDIVDRAENRTNFKVTADGSFGVDADKIHATAEGGGDSAKISETTKKDFHEAVLKSAHEYKQDNKTEVETSTSEESESTTYNEIQNPNDELTVTYLFYELQRTYHISEKIHQVMPVVLVANKVPAPHEIDDAWLIKNDWILRRVLLDDSFRSALDYLTKSFVGDELNLQILDNNVQAQRQVVETIKSQVAAQISVVQAAQSDLNTRMDVKGGLEFAGGFLNTVKNVFDPLHLTGQNATETAQGADTITTYAQETLDRAEREKIRFLDQLGIATTALQAAVDKLAAAMKEHYDKVAEIDRLRLHVKENIIYYMQAIWNHEPPDQRYFRVFQIQVPVPVPIEDSTNIPISLKRPNSALTAALLRRETAHVPIPLPKTNIKWMSLVDIADLDNVVGYKGNYAIYRLKENNCLTLHMMQDYLDLSDEFTIRDPDDFANYTVDELQDLATCLYSSSPDVYRQYKDQIRQWMIDRLTSGRPEDDRVIVPTKSLYVEALVGTHPLLEDFKLLHRALDVKKVQGEVRHAELENVRLAARALEDELEDPNIDKKILIKGKNTSVAVQPEA